MASDTHPQYAEQGMPFRRLGPSGLRVPLFSVGGCMCSQTYHLPRHISADKSAPIGLTIGGSVVGDPVKASLRRSSDPLIFIFALAGYYQNGVRERDQHVRHRGGLLEGQVRDRDVGT